MKLSPHAPGTLHSLCTTRAHKTSETRLPSDGLGPPTAENAAQLACTMLHFTNAAELYVALRSA